MPVLLCIPLNGHLMQGWTYKIALKAISTSILSSLTCITQCNHKFTSFRDQGQQLKGSFNAMSTRQLMGLQTNAKIGGMLSEASDRLASYHNYLTYPLLRSCHLYPFSFLSVFLWGKSKSSKIPFYKLLGYFPLTQLHSKPRFNDKTSSLIKTQFPFNRMKTFTPTPRDKIWVARR